MDRKQKQLPPISSGRDGAMSPRGYERENTSPRGYNSYDDYSPRGKDRERFSPRGSDGENISPRGRDRENISPRSKNERISPRMDTHENTKMSRREREMISPRMDREERTVSPKLNRRSGARSPRLERREQTGAAAPLRARPDPDGALLNNRRKSSDPRSQRSSNGDLNPVEFQDFRNLCIGSPIPVSAYGENESPYGENHRRNSSEKPATFPSIKVQNCEEGEESSSPSSSPREAEERPAREGRRAQRSHSPTPPAKLKQAPMSPRHRPKTIDATFPTASTGQLGRTQSGNQLLSPNTPPVQRKVGNKKFVVYDKGDGPSPTDGKIPQLSATSQGNMSEGLDRESIKLNLKGDEGGSLPTTPWTSPRSSSPNRLSSSDGASHSYNRQNKPHHLQPINQPRGRHRQNTH